MNESALNKLDRTYFKQWRKDPTGYVCGNIPVRLLVDLAKENETLRKAMNESANEIINRLIRHIEKETCMHEDTHRGGAIWEICDQCGEKWADDRGGKPDFEWPDCLIDAYKFLDEQKNIKNNQRESKPMNESALKVISELYPIHGMGFWKHVSFKTCRDGPWIKCRSIYNVSLCDYHIYKSDVSRMYTYPSALTCTVERSIKKYPENKRMFDGLISEVEELARAFTGDGDVRSEALDVAACAIRIYTEGDAGLNRIKPDDFLSIIHEEFPHTRRS